MNQGLAPRVLIVGSAEDDLAIYGWCLTREGFRVVAEPTYHHLVATVLERGPEVIVLEVYLGDDSGWEACASLKSDPRTAAIPIVVLTADARPECRRRARELGCAAFLLKPCGPDEVVAIIHRCAQEPVAGWPGPVAAIPQVQRRDVVSRDELTRRIRAEFMRQPGLILTADEAARLLAIDPGVCSRVLEELLDAGWLRLTPAGYTMAGLM